MKMGVVGRAVMEQGIRNIIVNSRTWSPIKKICGHSESFCLLGGWHVCVSQESAAYVVQGANDTFGLTVLG